MIEEVSSNAPSGLAAISVPASPSTGLSRVSQLSPPPAQDTQVHGKGAAWGVKSPSQFPVLPSPLGDAGEGCTRLTVGLNDLEGSSNQNDFMIALGWGSACRGLKAWGGWVSLDLHSQAARSQLCKEEEEDCSQQSAARSPRPGEDAKGGVMR